MAVFFPKFCSCDALYRVTRTSSISQRFHCNGTLYVCMTFNLSIRVALLNNDDRIRGFRSLRYSSSPPALPPLFLALCLFFFFFVRNDPNLGEHVDRQSLKYCFNQGFCTKSKVQRICSTGGWWQSFVPKNPPRRLKTAAQNRIARKRLSAITTIANKVILTNMFLRKVSVWWASIRVKSL